MFFTGKSLESFLKGWLVAVLTLASMTAAAGKLSLQVQAPFVELHSAPGERFPILQVAEQGDRLNVLVRRADWYKVRAADGSVGWVSGSQLASSLEDAEEVSDSVGDPENLN